MLLIIKMTVIITKRLIILVVKQKQWFLINQLSPINIYCDKAMENAEIKKSYFTENIWLKLKSNNYQPDIESSKLPILTTKLTISVLSFLGYNTIFKC